MSIIRIVDMIDSPKFDPSTNNGRGDWSLRDVTTDQVFLDCEWHKPTCRTHGAMNALNPDRTIWRCLTCGRACFAFWDD